MSKALYLFTCPGGFNQEYAESEAEAWEKFKGTTGDKLGGWSLTGKLETQEEQDAYYASWPLFD